MQLITTQLWLWKYESSWLEATNADLTLSLVFTTSNPPSSPPLDLFFHHSLLQVHGSEIFSQKGSLLNNESKSTFKALNKPPMLLFFFVALTVMLARCFIQKSSDLIRWMVLSLLLVFHEADIMTTLTHWRLWIIRNSWGSALLKRKETNTFHIPSGAQPHTHIHCAHTCVKLKPSQPYIWLRLLFLLIKHFSCRSIAEDTFSCFDGLQVTRVMATRCIYMYCRWCQQIEMEGEQMWESVCVCGHVHQITYVCMCIHIH